MAGFDGWIEIFEGGTQEDSRGRTKYYSDAELEHMVNSYDSKKNEAPLVFGHPKDNHPALGWVESLKKEGLKILAKFRQVPQEVKDWVEQGLWKKRSASIRADGTLKHVGLLGAVPPAIKGLADIQFSDNEDDLIYYFNENGGEEMASSMSVARTEIDDRDKKIKELQSIISEFAEQQKAKDKEIVELKTAAASSNFAERERQREEELAAMKAKVEKLEKEKRQKDFSDFCEHDLGDKLPPADKSFIIDLFDICHTAGEYNFSEGGNKDAVEKCKDFLKRNLPNHKLFKEIATKDKATSRVTTVSNYSESADEDEMDLDQKASDYAEKNNVTYEFALKKVRNI